jgi:hypothetical protein
MMETNGKFPLSCEQAEAIVLDLYSDGATDAAQRSAALAHVSHCSRCASLQESWAAAKQELRALSEETLDAQAPARVEMRLLQEFRAQHRKAAARRMGFVAAWTLAAAVIAFAAMAWWNSRIAGHRPDGNAHPAVAVQKNTGNAASSELIAGLSTGDDSGDFTPLPGAVASDYDDAAILRVRMQRASLNVLGLPVNEQRANDWIQVDLMVGADGSPEAIRLAQEEN